MADNVSNVPSNTVFLIDYWDYYISLEQQLLETRRYVEFDLSKNDKTYSIEYLKLFQAICSEIDVVGKVIVNKYYPNEKIGSDNMNIYKWWHSIQKCFPEIQTKTVFLDETPICPWGGFFVECYTDKNGKTRYRLDKNHNGKTLFWWKAYNDVKHHRTDYNSSINAINYAQANQMNVVFAFAALFVLETSLFEKEIYKVENASQLFCYPGEKYHFVSLMCQP